MTSILFKKQGSPYFAFQVENFFKRKSVFNTDFLFMEETG